MSFGSEEAAPVTRQAKSAVNLALRDVGLTALLSITSTLIREIRKTESEPSKVMTGGDRDKERFIARLSAQRLARFTLIGQSMISVRALYFARNRFGKRFPQFYRRS